MSRPSRCRALLLPTLVLTALVSAGVLPGVARAREVRLPAPEAPDPAAAADVAGDGVPVTASPAPTPTQPRAVRPSAAPQVPARVPAPLRDEDTPLRVPRFHRFLPGMMH